MNPGTDVWFAVGPTRLAGSRWFTGYLSGWRPHPLSLDQVPGVISSVEQQIVRQAARQRRDWLLLLAAVIWTAVSFSTIVRLTIQGIYAAPSMAAAYGVVALAGIVLTWPALVVLAFAPRGVKHAIRMNRDLYMLAEHLRTDESARALARELASANPRVGVLLKSLTADRRAA
ncbi:MAG TPA: hypothetical protein VGK50_07690 [Coriobacteriia bacterium]|jgi:hypothetical protein